MNLSRSQNVDDTAELIERWKSFSTSLILPDTDAWRSSSTERLATAAADADQRPLVECATEIAFAAERFAEERFAFRCTLSDVLGDLKALANAAPAARPVLEDLSLATRVAERWDDLTVSDEGDRCRDPLTQTMTLDFLLGRVDELYQRPGRPFTHHSLLTACFLDVGDDVLTRALRWIRGGEALMKALPNSTVAYVRPVGFAAVVPDSDLELNAVANIWESLAEVNDNADTVLLSIHPLPVDAAGVDVMLREMRREWENRRTPRRSKRA